jgi:hypothetical protein
MIPDSVKQFDRGPSQPITGEDSPRLADGAADDHGSPLLDELDTRNWPTPAWYESKNPRPLKGYRDYFRLEVRSRYAELEGDYRSVCGNYWNAREMDVVTAKTIADLLHRSRAALEPERPDLLSVAGILDLVERYMVWTYPSHILDARVTAIQLRIENLAEPERTLYRRQFEEHGALDRKRLTGGKQRSFYDEVISAYNRRVRASHISRALQIERLKVFLQFGCALLLVFIVAFPLVIPAIGVSPGDGAVGPLTVFSTNANNDARAWILGVSLALMGAMGAFISGLIQVRQSDVTLPEYEESMLKLAIRPMLGANLALVLYVFLAWQVIAGVSITSTGSYFLVAFLAGFSERYFLRLLDLAPDDTTPASERSVQGAIVSGAEPRPPGPAPSE